ncbi:MAG: cobaltochelatase subunit CobT [Devosia sp.]|nr:cobaltochelatase subunit CobT [Devosia sp.]
MSAEHEEIRSTILKRDARGVIRNGAEWLALWSDPDTLKSRAERLEDQAEYRHRVVLGQQLSAAARSVAEDASLDIEVGDKPGNSSGLKVGLSELSDVNLPALRGRLDAAALFVRFHDPEMHVRLAPSAEGDRRFADLLDSVRCEALGIAILPGVEENIIAYHRDRLARSDLLGAHLASLIPLAEALRMVLRDALTGRTEPSMATSGFWMWDRWLRDRLTPQLGELCALQKNQAQFTERGRKFMQAVFRALEGGADAPVRRALSKRPGGEGEAEGEEGGSGPDGDEGDKLVPGDELFAEDSPELNPRLLYARPDAHRLPYASFTTIHDRIVSAESLGDKVRLREARLALDRKRAEYRRDFAKLVAQLQRRLMALQRRSWTFDLEEGLVDASRLDRVVVNPGFADAYKQEEESLFRDTAVTLLIDNSGSMRGKPIEIAATVAEMVAAALEQCSVAVEILGFTTVGWRGGQSAQDWVRAGRPANPGRLNDLRHIVYKGADEPFRQTRNNLAAMLASDLLKENVDGEALLWAARRLSSRAESRRVLIVVSDGAPVDQATLEANDDSQILDRHLREVIAGIERGGQIELAAIGIRHDVAGYYRRAVRVEKVEELGARLIEMLDRLVAR